MRILVAEDDMANRKFLEKFLGKYGEVLLAENGMVAVDTFVEHANKKQYFDLICLDIMMPKIDGYKALAAIRDAEKKLETPRDSIIMISALDEVGELISQSNGDYDSYISKPIDLTKFSMMLKELGLIS